MCCHAENIRDDFKPQGVTNMLCSLAKLGEVPGSGLLMALSRQAVATARLFRPSDLSNLMWAFATLGSVPDQILLQRLFEQAVKILPQFNPLDITNLTWALAILRVDRPKVLIDELLCRARALIAQFKLNELVLFFWSCATMHVGRKIVHENKHLIVIEKLNSHDTTNVFWTLAKLNIEPGEHMNFELSRHIDMIQEQLKPQEVSCLMWALAKLNTYPDERLQNAMMCWAVTLAGQFTAQEVANLMWALAILDIEPTLQLVEGMHRCSINLVANGEGFKAQEICNLLWALACLGLQHKVQFSAVMNVDCLRSLVKHCLSVQSFSEMPLESLCQIHQILISAKYDSFYSYMDLVGLLSAGCVDLCKYTFETSGHLKSNLQSSVAQCLKHMNFSIIDEFVEQKTGYTIDIMVLDRKSNPCLAIEVDGPSHFLRIANGKWRLNGTTRWKQRLLASAGFPPVSVPFWEWRNDWRAREKESYLSKLLFNCRTETRCVWMGDLLNALCLPWLSFSPMVYRVLPTHHHCHPA